MDKLETLQELLHNQLRDIYSAERQLLESLPILLSKAPDDILKKFITNHLKETREHKRRLDDISRILGIELSGEICRAMEALVREAKSIISVDSEARVKNAGIISTARRMEQYEISAYGAALQFALALKYRRAIYMLKQTLSEKKQADKKLAHIIINPRA